MWFELPEGMGGFSVAQQEFVIEVRVEGEDGKIRHYLRAPAHFAPQIIDIGCKAVARPPAEGDWPDIPAFDPDRDTAMGALADQVSALTQERDNALAALAPLQRENLDLQRRIATLEEALKKDAEVTSTGGKKA